jgi:phosphate transport system protein
MLHTHTQYDTELYALRCATTTMASDVERQFLRAVDAVRTQNLSLANQVLIEEAAVNAMHIQIDLRCNQIIAKRQPLAVDLREILAILHINSDLERIGDEAKKIARKVRELKNRAQPIDSAGIEQMTQIVCEMLRASVEAFVLHDATVAKLLQVRDAEVDALRDQRIAELLHAMSQDPTNVSAALALVFVVQSIERVGDHAKNIAEYVVNVVEGIDPRHGGLIKIS